MAISKERYHIDNFYGYNHGLKINAGEFYDMKNLSSSYYPVLSSRNKRAKFESFSKATDVFSKENFIYVKENEDAEYLEYRLYYNGKLVEDIGPLDSRFNGRRSMVSMGAYAIIIPDNIYLNTSDIYDCGYIEADFECEKISYSLCDLSGENYEDSVKSDVAPEKDKYWLDTSSFPCVLKKYDKTSSMWISIATTYIKISAEGIGKNFKEDDCVEISGVGKGKTTSITDDGVLEALGERLNTYMTLYGVSDDYIIVAGIIEQNVIETENKKFKVSRKCPEMDLVCEGQNRIWGCNSKLNEIYCCKLGDFKNWRVYRGLSSDSYAATVGSSGSFTGAIRYGDYILFLKENCIHKIYGTNPPFQIATSYVNGVQKGSEESLCVVNETLFYKSPTGVCAYEGGAPISISDDFGTAYYTNAIGGAFRNKYYISMSANEENHLFVYDTTRGLWHIEDYHTAFKPIISTVPGIANNDEALVLRKMISNEGNLYLFYSNNEEPCKSELVLVDYPEFHGRFELGVNGIVLSSKYGVVSPEKSFVWEAETGIFGLDIPEYKYPNRIIIRYSAKPNTLLKVYIDYDSSGEYELLQEFNFDLSKTHGAPLAVKVNRRCDHFRLKFEGVGDVKIFSVTFNLETGGEFH